MKLIQKYVISLLKNAPDNINLYNIDFSKVIKFLTENKISLVDLCKNELNESFNNFFESPKFKKVYQIHLQQYNDWKNDFIKIKNAWDKEGIDYIFHKSIGQFPYMSDNLDVLVKAKDFEKAGKTLVNMGFVELRNIQEAHKKFYRKFYGEKEVAPIHLHERVCWGVPYENNEHLWKHYIISDQDEVVHYPCREDSILIHSAHCFLEDHLIKIFDLLTIREIIGKNNVNWHYIIKTAEGMYWLHALYTGFLIFDYLYLKLFKEPLFPPEIIKKAKEHVSKKRWIKKTLKKRIFIDKRKMPFKIPHLWTRRHSSLRIINDPSFGTRLKRYKQVFEHLLNGLIHLKLGIKLHPKMFAAFSGLDGSGKTKHIEKLQNVFRACEVKSNYVWNRAGSLPIASSALKIARFFKFRVQINRKNSSSDKTNNLPKNGLTIKVWRIINSIDLILFYFFKINIPLILGKVIICDRYVYDSIIDLEYIGKSDNFNRIIYKMLKFLAPIPNIQFFLDLNPNIILQRGCEEPKIELANKYIYYRKMMAHTNAIIVDNSRPFDEVSEKISNITLTKFYKKYPEKYDGYRIVSFRYK